MTHEAAPRAYDLAERYRPGAAPVLLTGVQAVARLIVEQHARDTRSGLRTASLVSGYQGSPLAGLDKTLASVKELRDIGTRLVPGLNEELAATTIWGSQVELPHGNRTRDGVVGVWYGKGPGVDRSGDALRHGSTYGANPRGGVLVLAADDPAAKSSTLPCVSERSLAAMGLPVLFPRDAGELVTHGLYGVELSRASGCWVGIKVVADVADGFWTVDDAYSTLRIDVPAIAWEGRPWTYRQRVLAAPPDSLLAEADLVGPRWSMVEAFAAANPIDVVEVDPANATMGIAGVGTAYDLLRQALWDLGVDDARLAGAGIRLMRIGMPYPLNAERARRFAAGLSDVLVVEDKTEFVETQMRDVLYGVTAAPRVFGKRDVSGRPLVPATGALTPDRLHPALRTVLSERLDLAPARAPRTSISLLPVARSPYFCSGCPHNSSTVVPEGSLAAGGIGCHTLVTMAPRPEAQVTGITQMGGEGAQWIGQAPFTDVDHIFQNMGDGTYFHSGQLAVQAAVAAGVNVTFKILHNDVVAMTGAQHAQGAVPVPALTRKLHAEGVASIVVCSDEPDKYGRRAGFAPGTRVWHRERLDEAQRSLRETPGVTVLIYDQHCAADARRLRKRGRLAPRTTRVLINEAVCEGCGDCGVKSNCLSVQPIDTEFGRKTRIDQNSCNTDYSCLAGDCPSFLTVEVTAPAPLRRPEPPAVAEPVRPRIDRSYDVFLAGIGGTGIVTVNQVLATAAVADGLRAHGLDQTGLSQKAGAVTSHLRLSEDHRDPANKLSSGGADLVLAFDLLVAGDPANLSFTDVERTTAVVSTSRTPTGEMVYDASVGYPDTDNLVGRLSSSCAGVVALDALAASQTLFATTEVANLLLVGAAYQAGLMPITAQAIEQAIELNGVAVELNIAAFRWGRVAVADPAGFTSATASPSPVAPPPASLPAGCELAGETRRLAQVRVDAVHRHSGARVAERYLALVEYAWRAERAVGSRTEFSEQVARQLHRLTTYKDEYEMARLLTDAALEQQTLAQLPGAARLHYNLHPPMLRTAGLKRKLRLGPAWRPVLRGLSASRRLRGTPFDPFGRARVRRLERALVEDLVAVVERLSSTLRDESYDNAVDVVAAAELIRGYEGVKLRSTRDYVSRRAELGVSVAPAVERLLPA